MYLIFVMIWFIRIQHPKVFHGYLVLNCCWMGPAWNCWETWLKNHVLAEETTEGCPPVRMVVVSFTLAIAWYMFGSGISGPALTIPCSVMISVLFNLLVLSLYPPKIIEDWAWLIPAAFLRLQGYYIWSALILFTYLLTAFLWLEGLVLTLNHLMAPKIFAFL